MSSLDQALEITFRYEGGFSNYSHDAGGKTRYGIIESVAREYGYNGEMEKLPKEMAIEIYKKKYWTPLNIVALNQEIANKIFDFGVNAGISAGGKVLQRALSTINTVLANNGKVFRIYHELADDGAIGPTTLTAYKIIEDRNEIPLLIKWLEVEKGKYYQVCGYNEDERLADGTYTQKGFIRSWSRRIMD